MTGGRFPGWNLTAEYDEPPWHEASRVGSKERLSVPTTIQRITDWMQILPVEVLGVLHEQRKALLLPWTPHGEKIVAWLNDIVPTLPSEERRQLLSDVQKRYVRLYVDKDPIRITLQPNIIGHLGVTVGDYVWFTYSDKGILLSGYEDKSPESQLWPEDFP